VGEVSAQLSEIDETFNENESKTSEAGTIFPFSVSLLCIERDLEHDDEMVINW